MKNRQPLAEIYVVSDTKLDEEYQGIVLDELNIRKISLLEDASSLLDYKFKPQLRTCGRKFGPKLNAAKEVIAALPGKETMAALENGTITITVDGENFEMTKEDFIVENVQLEGLATQANGGITVSIDIKLTDELIEAGNVREIISKIQNMRKDTAGLEVTDRIVLSYAGNDKIAAIIEANKEYIASEVLAVEINSASVEGAKESNINGEKVMLALKKA